MTDDFPELSDEDWADLQGLIDIAERKIGFLRRVPAGADDAYQSSWRTFLSRRRSGSPEHWRDSVARSPEEIKFRLIYHVRRKIGRHCDQQVLPRNRAVRFSEAERGEGRPIDAAGPEHADAGAFLEDLLAPCVNLSDQQKQVARMCVEGFTVTEIAAALSVPDYRIYRDFFPAIRAAVSRSLRADE